VPTADAGRPGSRHPAGLLLGATMLWLAAAPPAAGTTTSSGDVAPFLDGCHFVIGPGFSVPLSNGDELEVGTNGVGVLTVQEGCTITFSNPQTDVTGVQVGGFPGTTTPPRPSSSGTGTVYIDGPGSSIATNAGPSNRGFFNVGRFGAASTGELYISNGGSLTTSGFNVGLGGASGIAVVDGPGSSVQLSGAFVTGVAAGGTIGSGASGNGTLTFRNGATFSMVGGPTATSGGPGYTVGSGGGTGTFAVESGAAVTIDGTGTSAGTGPGFTLGNNGTGTLTVDHATLSIVANPLGGGMTIGTNGGTGTATFRNGAGYLFTGSSGPGGFNLGRTAGSQGTLNVLTGATLVLNSTTGSGGFTIGDLGTATMTLSGLGSAVLQDGLAATARPFTVVGAQPGSQGTLSIEHGATLTIHKRSGGTEAVCCMQVGRQGHGVLRILNGGKLIIRDDSDATNFRLTFGGSPTLGAGTYDARISGVGSELIITGKDASFTLGRNADVGAGPRTLTIDSGATVTADSFHVAYEAGSTATMTISGPGTTINLVGDPDGGSGAGFIVGARGTGTLNLTDGAVITIDGSATPQPTGFAVGGSRTSLSGGTGILTVDGIGTRIQVTGTLAGFNVGFDNTCLNAGPCNRPSTGTVGVSGGGQIIFDAGHRGSIAGTPGSTGTVAVSGTGSLLDAGTFLGLGKDRDGNPGGTGTLTVAMGGTARAGTINCGAGGTINGDGGTLIGDVIADPGCTINPGASPGTLSIVGSFTGAGAKIVLEVDQHGNHDLLAVQGTSSFDPSTQLEVRIDPAYQPSGGALLQMVQVQATPQDPPQPLLTLAVAESGGGTVQTQGDLANLAQPVAVVPDITIDPTVRAVVIDIKPGEFPNVINLRAAGTIPVAILSTPAVDALEVDPLTIALHSIDTAGSPNVKLAAKGERPLCHTQDVNGDGLFDLVCHVVTASAPLEGQSIAVLDATLKSNGGPAIPIRGADFIRIVP
jgi:T5SS/PEP-CTERM-associated repeat protein